ncbi:MAG TPA: nucleoside hydrolase [Bryobacteraceae bacterium]|nr:nucleoside hydrolase [Bryobacteraceae bacterium]
MFRIVAIALSLGLAIHAATPVPVIFDTDMGNDVDDALALAMLHALESRGECRIVAVTVTKDNPWAAVYIDLVNTFYGRAYIPVGAVKASGVTPEDSRMIQAPAERKDAAGRLVYLRRLASGAEAPEATAVLLRALAAEADGSVTIVQVGFSTNLARLLASEPEAVELVRRKVKVLVMMAGNFAEPKPEFNVAKDVASAARVLRDWPGPIVLSGFEIGNSMLFPAAVIERDFAYVENHPIADAYRSYMKMPYDRPTWDLTAALYAVRPDGGYFNLSAPGDVTADAEGRTVFHADPAGRCRYLTIDTEQRVRTLEAMELLASQPPDARR